MYDEDEFMRIRECAIRFMHQRYTTILNEWCKEAGVDTPIGYHDNHQGALEIYTDKPGYLIGKGGELCRKYEKMLSEEFNREYKVRFMEVCDGFANV